MKILLTAINAKYIHSNLAVYSLQAYAAAHGHKIERAEYTINNQLEDILEKIYRQKPDVLLFSCYIWNIEYVKELVSEFHKLRPEVPIWVGGPEVSFETERFLRENPAVTGIMMGEGERTLTELCDYFEQCEQDTQFTTKNREEVQTELVRAHAENEKRTGDLSEIKEKRLEKIDGISYRRSDGTVAIQPLRSLLPMDELPFCYANLKDFEHRIIYYESSRGCPFSCSYCLSSVDKKLRFRSLPLVYKELQFFIDNKVPQVKFVDRTFNCKHDHAMAIWRYITEHDNGITNFHFEISADLLREEELALMKTMRPGLIQLEIGVQSTNPQTIKAIRRTMDFEKLKGIVEQIHGFGNIHQHLDLIAGLPYEDYDSFHRSFNDVYALRPQQLQLGFLKVLKGSHMKEMTEEYGIVHKELEPYEVLGTRWLPYEDILKLKMVESMVELYYNSGQFQNTIACVEPLFEDAFTLYEKLGQFYEKKGYSEISHSRMRRYEILLEFVKEELEEKSAGKSGNQDPEVENPAGKTAEDCRGMETATWEKVADSMIYDLYLRENLKSHPSFEYDQKPYEKAVWEYRRQEKVPKTAHIEVFRDGKILLFDYENRDPLLHNAAVKEIQI